MTGDARLRDAGPQACPRCGVATPLGFRFCGHCGTELRPDLPRELRRHVTVYFSDLAGSTKLGERLDSEALYEVLSRYFEVMRAPIERYGGTIEKLIGDAIVAVFGLPVVHDDDPLRALRAAAECQTALNMLNDDLERLYGVRLVNRTGLATGEVVVGLPGPGEHVLTGDVLRIAAELEASAPPMGILADGVTVRAAGVTTVAAMHPAVVQPAVAQPGAHGKADLADAWELVRADGLPGSAAARLDVRGTLRAEQPCPNCGEDNPAEFVVCGTCGGKLHEEQAVTESRKTVTVVFADLRPVAVDGATLAADRVREVVSLGFTAARAVVERHGGRAEKFIGDAVVAVFGLPVLHEDDALRAVRASLDIHEAVAALNLRLRAEGVSLTARIGVNTGVAVSGHATKGLHLVTGDAVNTAARLEQAAPDGGVFLGDATYVLVRDAVAVEAPQPLSVKGKAEPVIAHRLLAVTAREGRSRRHSAPLEGREQELAELRGALGDVVIGSVPDLVTIIGDAGIGKSRLVREFEAQVGHGVQVLRGRCPAYGGSTFAPIVEMIRSVAKIRDDDTPEQARARLEALLPDPRIADRLAVIAGLADTAYPLAELSWGVRRLAEVLADWGPLLLVVDGLQWAEPALLDLLGHLVTATADAPVLLVGLARNELLEANPDWAPGSGRRIVLAPLDRQASGRIVDDLLPGGANLGVLRDRIVAGGHGNPLFIEQLVTMLLENGSVAQVDGRWVPTDAATDLALPPSIGALLAARVDVLPRDERAIVERAAVVGYAFEREAVVALSEQAMRDQVSPGLDALVSRGLVRPDPDLPPDAGAYRFHNQLIRDAAYGSLLKRSRVSLHERYVAWSDMAASERGRRREFDEVLGYHLEQAYRYRLEFGPPDAAAVVVGRDGARRLTAGGRRSFRRGDMAAAAGLLSRATGLLAERDPERLMLLPELAEAYLETGQFERCDAVLTGALEIAETDGDVRLGSHATLVGLLLRYYQGTDGEGWSGRAALAAERAIEMFEGLGDEAGLTRAWRVIAGVNGTACRYRAAAGAAEQILEHAARAGDRRQESRGATAYAQASLLGPTPVPAAIDRCRKILGTVEGDRRTEALVLLAIAELEGLTGAFDDARAHYKTARTMLEDLGSSVYASSTSQSAFRVELLAGAPEEAERLLRADYEALDAMGERYLLSSLSVYLGRVLLELGRRADAEAMAARARELADADDVEAQALWRTLEAQVAVRRSLGAGGEMAAAGEAAVALAQEALSVLEPTDATILRADAYAALADVQALAGQPRAAVAETIDAALALYDAKGATAAAARVRSRSVAQPVAGELMG
jgi:class 3 adenylate cyclase/tetratricopeptide (TPR) repeat protein